MVRSPIRRKGGKSAKTGTATEALWYNYEPGGHGRIALNGSGYKMFGASRLRQASLFDL